MIGEKIQLKPIPEPAEKSGFMVYLFEDNPYYDGFVVYMDWDDPIEGAYDEKLCRTLNHYFDD